jgi:GNAT superfamily N-acetyltransferase
LNVVIRAFEASDAPRVRELFVAVNRLLAPPGMEAQFERYIERALREEIDRIADYYRDGGFWVAEDGRRVVGTFGLEPAGTGAMELRRMYVDPSARRSGIGSKMLLFAEAETLRRACTKLVLSTSALQTEAIALYVKAGYSKTHEQNAEPSHKSVGGLARLHFEKYLF